MTAPATSPHVADHAEGQGPLGPQSAAIDVHLHDDGVVGDQPAVPHGPHVQRAAPADDQVGGADELGGQRGGEAAGDVECPLHGVFGRNPLDPGTISGYPVPQSPLDASAPQGPFASSVFGSDSGSCRCL